jgi:Tol biopolymer transport system component
VSGANATRFTFYPGINSFPVWSPDGSRIVWVSTREDGRNRFYQKAASGVGQEEPLLNISGVPYDWSRDGRFIIYSQSDLKTRWDVWVLPLDGEQKPFPFLQTDAYESTARLSPDGRWLAYVSDESGRFEVYVQRFPAHGSKRQVSTGGGAGPHWRRDGKELFYYAADGKLMAMPVGSGESFEMGTAVALFEFRFGSVAPTSAPYTVTGDGQRFLVNAIVDAEPRAPLTVVVNWAAGARR